MSTTSSKRLKIVFRTDASILIGTGHVMRCLTLADELARQDHECRFICREHEGHLGYLITSKGHGLTLLPPCNDNDLDTQNSSTDSYARWLGVPWQEDARQTLDAITPWKPDWLVVDHYALDAQWEKALRSHCRKLMVIDDLADRPHVSDLLLDQNFARTADDYARLVPTHCLVLVGSRHVLLRPQFADRQQTSLERRRDHAVKHFLIQMGGREQCKFAREALSVLQECDLPHDARITVVLSIETPETDFVRCQAAIMKWPTTIRIGVQDMAKLMEESDFAIGTGGGATYERLFMRLPSILRPAAENQIEPLRKMADAKLFEIFESAGALKRRVKRLLRDGVCPPPRVVYDGTKKLVGELLKLRVTLRLTRPLDIRRTFHWLQDDGLRVLFLMRHKPELRSHFAYWKTLLRDPQQYAYSIYYDDVHVGNAGLKNISIDNGEAELWLYLGESSIRGKGIGQQALDEIERVIRNELNLSRAVLHVGRNNYIAKKLYQRSGYSAVPAELQSTAGFKKNEVIRMEKRL